MFICGTPADKEHAKRSREIDRTLLKDKKVLDKENKLLLLGPGESGKSTIFKQMKIISENGGGYSEDEKKEYRDIIFGNIVSQTKVLIGASSKLNLPYAPEHQPFVDLIMKISLTRDQTWSELGKAFDGVKGFWNDPNIKKVYEKRDVEYQLNDSAGYFFDNIDRFKEEDKFVPSQDDVLRSRVRTSGIDEAVFNFDKIPFRMVDVGGQRTERRKWIHCFDSVTAVIYITSLTEYDQKLREDPTQNRMKESLLLFNEIANSNWFRATPTVLFLNKTDLFQEKIKKSNLAENFPDYSSGPDVEKAKTFILQKFLQQNQNQQRKIYSHFTCAVDTDNVVVVFSAVRITLLSNSLADLNL